MLETETRCIDDEDIFQSVTDTDNEFTECQTPRKKLQSYAISPASLHAVPLHIWIANPKIKLGKVMNTIKNDISEAHKV